jgi:non-specific serine/threonine protein kinase
MGGCTLEAVEAICSPPMDTLNGVASLTDNNLLRQEVDLNGEPRFVLLETIREYALERLQESGEEPTLRQSHADYYVALAERTEAELQRDGYLQWLDSMEVEHGNLRITLDWCEKLDIEKGLRLIVASHHPVTLSTHNHALEGGERVERLLNADSTVSVTNPLLWARALNVAARLAYVRKDILALSRWAEKALYFSRQIVDEKNTLYALRSMGQATALQGLDQLSETINIEGLALARETGNNWFICFFLNIMGLLNRNRGDYAKAFSYHAEAAKLVRHIEDKPFVLTILWELGTSSLFVENFEQGYQCYLESISSSKERILAYDLEGFAGLAAFQKHPERAAGLLGAAEALRETQDTPRMKFDQYYEQFVAMTRAQLDEPAFNAAWAEGRAMTLEQALAYALSDANS